MPIAGNVEANIAEHVTLAQVAAANGARILVFPELSLTGYEMSCASELAFVENDPRLGPLEDAARSHQVTLVVGAPLRMNANLYIAAFIIESDGRVQVYTKHHLGTFPPSASVDGTVPAGEPTVFTEGTLNPLVDVGGYSAAVAVCADANRASHAANAAARGVRSYLVSGFVIPSEFAEATENLQTRAEQHRMAVAFSNFGGRSGMMATAGQSSFWSEDGKLLHRLNRHGRGVLVALENQHGWRVAVGHC